MFIASLFIMAIKWKLPKCPSVDEWMNKMWYIPIVDSAIKRNELL